MKSRFARLFILTAMLAVAVLAQAQSSTSTDQYRGFNGYESFRGVVTSSRSLLKLDSSLGYDFNRNFGVFAGVPLYFTTNSGIGTGLGNLQEHGIGDAYFGAEVYVPTHFVRYSSTVTIAAPTGNVEKGFSPGQVTADWSNRFRHSFGRLTPSFSLGVGNSLGIAAGTLPSSELVAGSLSAVGTAVHLREGAEFELSRRTYVGGAGYQILPVGNSGGVQSPTTGNNLIRENGVDTWLGFEPTRVVRLELGYSHSTTFALDSLSFNVGLNVGRMLRLSRSASLLTK